MTAGGGWFKHVELKRTSHQSPPTTLRNPMKKIPIEISRPGRERLEGVLAATITEPINQHKPRAVE